MEISRNVPIQTLRNQYRNIIGNAPRAKGENETYESYKNVLVNTMLGRPGVKLKFGERISKNTPTDSTGSIGRPKTNGSNRQRVCEIVAKGKNDNKVAEQNYVCRRRRIEQKEEREVKEEKEFKEEFVTLNQLESRGIDIMRRVVTALIPTNRRTKTILQQQYNARRGVLNDLSVANMIDLLRRNNITQISSSDAVKILLK